MFFLLAPDVREQVQEQWRLATLYWHASNFKYVHGKSEIKTL